MPSPTHTATARWVSIAGHPFVLIPSAIAIAIYGRASTRQAGELLAAVVVSLSLVAAYVYWGLRRGKWTHIDVSERERRWPIYLLAMAASAASALLLYALGQPAQVVRGAVVACVLLGVCLAVNARLKVSLHTAFAVYAAGIAGVTSRVALVVILLLALAIAWGRVTLGRHSRAEVLWGWALGGMAASALFV